MGLYHNISRRFYVLVVGICCFMFYSAAFSQPDNSFKVSIEIDADEVLGELKPNYAYMKYGKKCIDIF